MKHNGLTSNIAYTKVYENDHQWYVWNFYQVYIFHVTPPTLRCVLAIFTETDVRQKLSSVHGIAAVQYEGQTSQGSNQK